MGLSTTNIELVFLTDKPEKLDNIEAADLIEKQQETKVFYENVCLAFGGDMNEDKWRKIMKKAENEAISVIPKLFFGSIITTNFDQIIENIYVNKLPVAFPYHLDILNDAIQKRKMLIYKIHGCASDA